MAQDPFDRESIEERNALQRDYLDLKRQEARMQAEQLSLSNTLLDTLQEELGIRKRKTTEEENVLSINRKINREILNQKLGLKDSVSLEKQIVKNNQNINIAKGVAASLESKISQLKKISADDEKLELELVKEYGKNLQQQIEAQAKIEQHEKEVSRLTRERAEANEDLTAEDLARINHLGEQIRKEEELISLLDLDNERMMRVMDSDSKRLALTNAQISALQKINDLREKEKEDAEKVEKSLGITGKLMNLIGSIPGLGKFAQDAFADVKKIQDALQEAGQPLMDSFQVTEMFLDKMKDGIVESINDPLTLGFVGLKVLGKGLLSMLTMMDERATSIQNQFGLSNSAASGLSQELAKASLYTGDLYMNVTQTLEAFTTLSDTFGILATQNEQQLRTFSVLTDKLGVGAREAGNLTALLGKNSEVNAQRIFDQVNAFNKFNKTAITGGGIMKDVAETSSAIVVSLGGSLDAITAANLEAKKLGLSLSQLDNVAESLLNFEQSIENELKAELLLGKEINLERARLLAINNDMEGLAKELNKQNLSFYEFSKLNRIQQQAAADAIGMSRQDMADMLLMQYDLSELSDEEIERLGEQNYERLTALTFQEKLNSAITNFKGLLLSISEGPLGTIVGFFSDIIGNAVVFNTLLATGITYLAIMAGKAVALFSLKVGEAVAAIFAGSVTTMGVAGLVAAGAGVATMLATIASARGTATQSVGSSYSVNDAVINSGGNIITTHPEDFLIATKDPSGLATSVSNSSTSMDTARIEAAIERGLREAARLNRNTRIVMNGETLGNVMARDSAI